jgi:protocatechuate 3,4-dioxygenase beta subunit
MSPTDSPYDPSTHDPTSRRRLSRRAAVGTMGGASFVAVLAACGLDDATSASTTTSGSTGSAGSAGSAASSTSATATDGSCSAIPEETAGPYPGDGSNGPDVLGVDGVVRRDITSSIGDAAGSEGSTVDGIPLEIRFTVTDAAAGCAPLAGAAVYAWHCDPAGRYSMYSSGVTDQNWLRGVAVADADGVVAFTTVFPGCYPGRWPHVHLEVYADEAAATGGGRPIATTQLAVPQPTCEEAYADSRYGSSARNLGQLSLRSDNIFGDDGGVHQVATVTGTASEGWTASLAVPVEP